ncbi:hypothetical protein B0H21DRAFT_285811 [Amylocystis lapponica]|nr:hypothetical protein B0H21DRAFT_285811 [Amylocystis lapponica]
MFSRHSEHSTDGGESWHIRVGLMATGHLHGQGWPSEPSRQRSDGGLFDHPATKIDCDQTSSVLPAILELNPCPRPPSVDIMQAFCSPTSTRACAFLNSVRTARLGLVLFFPNICGPRTKSGDASCDTLDPAARGYRLLWSCDRDRSGAALQSNVPFASRRFNVSRFSHPSSRYLQTFVHPPQARSPLYPLCHDPHSFVAPTIFPSACGPVTLSR